MMPERHQDIAFTLGEIKGTLNEIKHYAKVIDSKVDRVAKDHDDRISTIENDRAYEKGAIRGVVWLAGVIGSFFGAIGGAFAAMMGGN